MKLADIGDWDTFGIRAGKHHKVGNWSYYDVLSSDNDDELSFRCIYHYGTLMGRLVLRTNGVLVFSPESAGWGSASDQQGMNKILANYGWRYRRNGGEARYERI